MDKKNRSSLIKGAALVAGLATTIGCSTPKLIATGEQTEQQLTEQLTKKVPPEMDARLVTQFDPTKHTAGDLIVTMPAGSSSAQIQSLLKEQGVAISQLIPLGEKSLILKVDPTKTQQARDIIARSRCEVVFSQILPVNSIGAYRAKDPDQNSFGGDAATSSVSADIDSLRAFLHPQFKNFKDDTIPSSQAPIKETVKIGVNELYDPKYIENGEFAPIDTVLSYNFIRESTNPKNFSDPLGAHGTVVGTNMVSKDSNGQWTRGAYNGGKIISRNCATTLGIDMVSFLQELQKALDYVKEHPGQGVVLNASHVTPAYNSAYEELCKQITATGAIILVKSAGNDGINNPDWGAMQHYPRWISVGGTGQEGIKRSGSSYGDRITTYFKGENMKGLSLGGAGPDNNGYNGTSCAAPWVSGWITLLWNLAGGPSKVSPAQLKALIENNRRVMVAQPDGLAPKPWFHMWDLTGRIINTMEEEYTEDGIQTDTINADKGVVDLKKYTHNDRMPWMDNITYSVIEYGADGKTVTKETPIVDGLLDPKLFPNGPIHIRVKWTNKGVAGPNYKDVAGNGPDVSDTHSFVTRHMNIKNSPTGIDDLHIPSLHVYPNPVVDELHITLPEGINDAHAVVYNTIGQEVFSGILHEGGKTTLHMGQLPQGVYLIKLEDDHGQPITKVARVVKK